MNGLRGSHAGVKAMPNIFSQSGARPVGQLTMAGAIRACWPSLKAREERVRGGPWLVFLFLKELETKAGSERRRG